MRQNSWAAKLAAGTVRLICTVAAGAGLLAAQAPSIILTNAKVLTVDKDFSIAEAVAITGNTITAVGKSADIAKLAGPNTQVIDLKGRTVTPGLMDTHRHYSADGTIADEAARTVFRVDWGAVKTKEDVLTQISQIIQKYKIKPGEWIHFNNAIGFMGLATPTTILQSKILFDQLNATELNKAAPNNPIIMSEGIPEYNGLLLNGVAMDILWKNYGDFIKLNGRYWIDSAGKPEGHLESVATRPVMMVYMPHPTSEAQAPGFRQIQEALAAMGLTTVSGRYPRYRVDSLKLLESRGQLLSRVAYGLEDEFGVIKDPDVELKKLTSSIGAGSEKIWITSVAPSSVDGSGSRMCSNNPKNSKGAIDNLYPVGQCYQDGEYKGAAARSASMPKNYYQDWIMASAHNGIRFANTHMSGDRSVALFLKFVGEAQAKYGPNSTKNWAADHCDLVNPADLPTAKKLGIRFSCYPNSVNNGPEVAENFGDKIANTYPAPLKSMLNAGIKFSYEGEGAPTVWDGLYAFVTRKDEKGHVWGPQEAIDKVTALKMATTWAAEYVLKPDKLGSIEKGKIADILVLDRDWLTIPDDDIKNVRPLVTIFDGKIVFEQTSFANEYNLKPAGAVISTYDELRKAAGGGLAGGGG
jgi:predicted amidohydrolase YtcJ